MSMATFLAIDSEFSKLTFNGKGILLPGYVPRVPTPVLVIENSLRRLLSLPHSILSFLVTDYHNTKGSWAYERLAEPATIEMLVGYLQRVEEHWVETGWLRPSERLKVRGCRRRECETEEIAKIIAKLLENEILS